MRSKPIKLLVASAVFAALIFAMTAFPSIPIPGGGYIHLGDAFVYLSAAILPAPYAVCAAAVGGSMADLISGFTIWLPATCVIKSLMALTFSSKSRTLLTVRNAVAALLSGLICAAGYYLYEALLLSSFAAALESLPFNLIQAVGSFAVFIVAAFAFDRVRIKSKL